MNQSVEQLNGLNYGDFLVSTANKYKLDQDSKIKGLYYQITSPPSAPAPLDNDILKKTMNINGLIHIEYYSKDVQRSFKTNAQLYIDYYCGGKGLSVSSSYYGFYYADNNQPDGWQHEVFQLTEYDNGWRWQEDDNWYYTERIRDNWFYYEMHF